MRAGNPHYGLTMKASPSRTSWRPAAIPPQTQAAARACDHPGCSASADFRAPRARDCLNEYYWFCLDHVRAYNSAWNYYAGMTPDEIEAELRKDSTWDRPTWPLGVQGAQNRRFAFAINDPFGVMGETEDESAARRARPPTPEEEAMKLLDLHPPLSAERLKARYKQLVKRHHPDANGGNKDAEERFKRINQAYTTLKRSLDA
jgi:hypothetical protein